MPSSLSCVQRELLARGDAVSAVERSVREVATLNSLFSAQVMQQAEQIEQLYSEVGCCCVPIWTLPLVGLSG